MNRSQRVAAATETLVARRVALSRSRSDNDAGAVALGEERRPEALAENDQISDVLMRLSARETAELGEVDAALERLSRGTWGQCEQCHGSIDARRMAVLPEARRCADCLPVTPPSSDRGPNE